MIYTGYYAKIEDYKKAGLTCIGISGIVPDGILVDRHWRFFAPSKDIFYSWKCGRITDEEYAQRFLVERLNKLDKNKIKQELDCIGSCILLCYEKEGFCHRHLVAQWIEATFYMPVREFKLK